MPTIRRRPSARIEKLSSVVLALVAGLCGAGALYALHRIGWGDGRALALYAGVPGALGLGFAAGLLFGAPARLGLIATAFTGLVGVYGAELYLTLGERETGQSRQVPAGWDARSLAEVVEALRASGEAAYPAGFGRTLLAAEATGRLVSRVRLDGREALPLGGVSNATTVACNEAGQYLVYRSDERGFHNPPGLWARAPLEVAALGDSFTHGACVASDRNMVAGVRTRFPLTLNLGMGGNGPLMMLAGIKEYLVEMRPRVVLWFYFEGNDLTKDLWQERASDLLMAYLQPDFRQGLGARQAEIDRALDAVAASELESAREHQTPTGAPPARAVAIADVVLLRALRHRMGLAAGVVDLELFRRVLAEAKRAVESWDGRLHFVYLPGLERYRAPLGAFAQDMLAQRVLGVVDELGVATIDLRPTFAAEPNPEALFHGHYNEAGHRLVAAAVLAALGAPPE